MHSQIDLSPDGYADYFVTKTRTDTPTLSHLTLSRLLSGNSPVSGRLAVTGTDRVRPSSSPEQERERGKKREREDPTLRKKGGLKPVFWVREDENLRPWTRSPEDPCQSRHRSLLPPDVTDEGTRLRRSEPDLVSTMVETWHDGRRGQKVECLLITPWRGEGTNTLGWGGLFSGKYIGWLRQRDLLGLIMWGVYFPCQGECSQSWSLWSVFKSPRGPVDVKPDWSMSP